MRDNNSFVIPSSDCKYLYLVMYGSKCTWLLAQNGGFLLAWFWFGCWSFARETNDVPKIFGCHDDPEVVRKAPENLVKDPRKY